MKYAIIIPDGCADEPQESLGGKTPLQAANIPHMDAVVQKGVIGAANHVPLHLPAGSAVANMSLLGFDPQQMMDKAQTVFKANPGDMKPGEGEH